MIVLLASARIVTVVVGRCSHNSRGGVDCWPWRRRVVMLRWLGSRGDVAGGAGWHGESSQNLGEEGEEMKKQKHDCLRWCASLSIYLTRLYFGLVTADNKQVK